MVSRTQPVFTLEGMGGVIFLECNAAMRHIKIPDLGIIGITSNRLALPPPPPHTLTQTHFPSVKGTTTVGSTRLMYEFSFYDYVFSINFANRSLFFKERLKEIRQECPSFLYYDRRYTNARLL